MCLFLLWLALTSQLEARYGGLPDFARTIRPVETIKVLRAGPKGLVNQVTKPSGQTLQNTAFDSEGRVLTQLYTDSTCYRFFWHRSFPRFGVVAIFGVGPHCHRVLSPNCRALVVACDQIG